MPPARFQPFLWRSYDGRVKALGVICGKASIGYTLLEGDAAEPVEEEELIVPRSRTARGDQLAWLLDEMEQVIRQLQPDVVWMKDVQVQVHAIDALQLPHDVVGENIGSAAG